MLEKLYSVDEVVATWPEGARPSRRRVLRMAKALGCCVKIGRGVGFTASQVHELQEAASYSRSGSIPSARRIGSSVERSKGSQYSKALELLTGAKPKTIDASEKHRSMSS